MCCQTGRWWIMRRCLKRVGKGRAETGRDGNGPAIPRQTESRAIELQAIALARERR
jgi:hypothetical protein